jgi:hypothetical protein
MWYGIIMIENKKGVNKGMKNEIYSRDRNKILTYEKGYIKPFVSYDIIIEERTKLKKPFEPIFKIVFKGSNMSYEDLLDIAESEGFSITE